MAAPAENLEQIAADVVRAHISERVEAVTRFPTGLCHFVIEVRSSTGRAYVVRMASPASRRELVGGLYWHPRLQAAGVPIPILYAGSTAEPHPYRLLERLPGSDLGQVYGGLSGPAKRALAERMAAIQSSVGRLPQPRRFGFAHSFEEADESGQRSWVEVVAADIARSEERIRRIGRISPGLADRVRAAVARHDSYLRRVRPVPFLDDATTKNVIVNGSALSGIVDTDEVCFGDPLYTLGLTQTALLTVGADTDYIEYWLEAMGATRLQRMMVGVYSLVFCLCLMSELGQVFNRPIDFSEARAEALRETFERLALRVARPV